LLTLLAGLAAASSPCGAGLYTDVYCQGPLSTGQLYNFFKPADPSHGGFRSLYINATSDEQEPIFLNDIFNGNQILEVSIDCVDIEVTSDAFSAGGLQSFGMRYFNQSSSGSGRVPLSSFITADSSKIFFESSYVPEITLNCAGKVGKKSSAFEYSFRNTYISSLAPGFLEYCSSNSTSVTILDQSVVHEIREDAVRVGDKRHSNLTLTLNATQLTTIQPGFINTRAMNEDAKINIDLHLEYNNLKDISEKVFRKYFDMQNVVMHLYVAENPLACDCSMAWLVRDPAYLANLKDTASLRSSCRDGRPIHSLTPQDFSHC